MKQKGEYADDEEQLRFLKGLSHTVMHPRRALATEASPLQLIFDFF